MNNKMSSKKEKTNAKNVIKMMAKIYKETSEHKKWAIGRWFGGIASGVISVFDFYIIGSSLDVALSGEYERLMSFIYALIAIFIIRILLQFTNPLIDSQYELRTYRTLSMNAYNKIDKLEMGYYENVHTADTISTLIDDIEKIKTFMGNTIAGFLSWNPVSLILSIIILCSINWKLTLFSLTIVPIVMFILNKVSEPLKAAKNNIQEHTAVLNSYLRDFIEGNDIYKAFNMHKSHTEKFQESCQNIANESYKSSLVMTKNRALQILMMVIPQGICMFASIYFIARNELTIGQYVIFSNMLWPLIHTFRTFGIGWAEMIGYSGTAERYFKFLANKEERTDGKDFGTNDSDIIVEFKNVSFSYHDDIPLLKDVSFKLYKNSRLALCGVSGSGKSTIFKLICGYYENFTGEIYIFGHDIRAWNLNALRKYMTCVTQDVFLFDDSIVNNIRMGNLDATDEMIEDASKKAYIDQFIKDVGERGAKVSGGQRQRIAVARALLKDAPLIMLDEPTSALDTKSEFYVQKSIENLKKGRSVLIIAHRLTTIIDSDQIILLEDGIIAEQGTHEQLIKSNKRYSELYRRQLVDQEVQDA
ncbi:MAG: ABC transporter ATP-binding protein [Clostridiaceae bacterium]|nr:ABC transporter ATP-binding protein [Clostridiaceae bacterium]